MHMLFVHRVGSLKRAALATSHRDLLTLAGCYVCQRAMEAGFACFAAGEAPDTVRSGRTGLHVSAVTTSRIDEESLISTSSGGFSSNGHDRNFPYGSDIG